MVCGLRIFEEKISKWKHDSNEKEDKLEDLDLQISKLEHRHTAAQDEIAHLKQAAVETGSRHDQEMHDLQDHVATLKHLNAEAETGLEQLRSKLSQANGEQSAAKDLHEELSVKMTSQSAHPSIISTHIKPANELHSKHSNLRNDVHKSYLKNSGIL